MDLAVLCRHQLLLGQGHCGHWGQKTQHTVLPPASTRNLNLFDLETFVVVCLVSVHLFQHMLAGVNGQYS